MWTPVKEGSNSVWMIVSMPDERYGYNDYGGQRPLQGPSTICSTSAVPLSCTRKQGVPIRPTHTDTSTAPTLHAKTFPPAPVHALSSASTPPVHTRGRVGDLRGEAF